MPRFVLPLAAAFLLVAPQARAQEQIYRSLTTEQMEEMLRRLNIDFKKVPAKTQGNFYYDYKKNNYSIRLYYYNGKDLMLDALFNAISLEKINEWNQRAKFSRANLQKDDKGPFTVLESNLDLIGGITEGTVRQFLITFDEELKSFSKHVSGGGGAGVITPPQKDPVVVGGGEKIITDVPSDLLERVLDGLGHKYKKTAMQNNAGHYYDYTSKNFQVRLYNYGKDLMIDCVFKEIPIDKVNKYNVDRSFIRCVLYEDKMGKYTALEANMDCVGGVTESIIREFIRVFDEETVAFSKYVNNLQGGGGGVPGRGR